MFETTNQYVYILYIYIYIIEHMGYVGASTWVCLNIGQPIPLVNHHFHYEYSHFMGPVYPNEPCVSPSEPDL